MKAKSKPIKKFTPQELNVDVKPDLEVVEVTEPPKRKAGIILSSVDELIDKLKNEAHVIWSFDLSPFLIHLRIQDANKYSMKIIIQVE